MTRAEFYALVERSRGDIEWSAAAARPRAILCARSALLGGMDVLSAVAHVLAGKGLRLLSYRHRDVVAALGLSRGDADVISWAANATMLGHPVVWAARRRLFEAAGVPLDETPPAQVKVCQWCLDADMVGVGLSDCGRCRQPICQEHGGPTGICPTCRGRS